MISPRQFATVFASLLSKYLMNLKSLFVTATCALSMLAHAGEGVFDSKGVKIQYYTEGEGEAVVLIHGWMGDSTTWGKDARGKAKLPTARNGFQLISLDCRGHGLSGKPHDPSMYGVEMANDVVRLLDHLKIKKAHLVGYSMGAFIAGKVVASNPSRVISVVYGGQAPILAGTKQSEFTEAEAFAVAVDAGKGMGEYIRSITPANQPKPTLEQATAYANFMYKGKDLKGLAASGRSFAKLAVRPADLKRGKTPTLFIHGGNESDYTKGKVAAARKILDTSSLIVIEGANHMTTLINPTFGASIDKFLVENRTKV
jgi:pimeloyl-ACP methyl ester carboxylesterase